MLKATDLHTYYGDSHVLQGISLEIEPGKIIGILGRNGMGKTTLINSIIGFKQPRQGSVFFDGEDLTGLSANVRVTKALGLVPQGRRIFRSLSVLENLRIGQRDTENPEWTEERIFELLPRIKERLSHKGDELSGGEQQMLAVARALMMNPKCLLMDEPTEGLAPIIVTEIGEIILELKKQGIAILLVEQNVPFALKITDYVHVMSKGAIVHSSPPEELSERDDIKTQYLGL